MTDEQWAAANGIAWNDSTMPALRGHDIGDAMDRLIDRASRNQSTRSAGSAEQAPASD